MSGNQEQTRLRLDGIQRTALIAGVLGLVGVGIGFATNPHQAFQSYLYAYFIPLGLALGSLGWTMINYLTGGFWGLGARRLFQAGIRTLPLMALLFVPIAYAMLTQPHGAGLQSGAEQASVAGEHGSGNFWLYPWTDASYVASHHLMPHKAQWFSGPWVLGRSIFYFAVWFLLANRLLANARKFDETGDPAAAQRTRTLSGPGFCLYFITMTFAGFDWAMSVQPEWFSTMYSVVIIVGQGMSTLAFTIVMLSLLKKHEPFSHFARPNLFADLGTLMFATVMFWAYTSFSQFLIIWSGNTGEEAPWYVLRVSHGWQAVGYSLALLQFALPFFLLLMRRIKKDASYVAFVACLLILMRFVDLYWQIAPPFHKEFSPHWLDLAAPVGLLGLWVAFFVSRLKAHPLMSPRQEAALHHVLAHTQHQH
jgi:hypothetical protein